MASGSMDAFVHADVQPDSGERAVDIAAAKLIVEEAGGPICDVAGQPLIIKDPLVIADPFEKRPVVAVATLELMDEILTLLR